MTTTLSAPGQWEKNTRQQACVMKRPVYFCKIHCTTDVMTLQYKLRSR